VRQPKVVHEHSDFQPADHAIPPPAVAAIEGP